LTASATDGHTYERKNILEHFRVRRQRGASVCASESSLALAHIACERSSAVDGCCSARILNKYQQTPIFLFFSKLLLSLAPALLPAQMTSPVTNAELRSTDLTPNLSFRRCDTIVRAYFFFSLSADFLFTSFSPASLPPPGFSSWTLALSTRHSRRKGAGEQSRTWDRLRAASGPLHADVRARVSLMLSSSRAHTSCRRSDTATSHRYDDIMMWRGMQSTAVADGGKRIVDAGHSRTMLGAEARKGQRMQG
jgi:hypothetical protein